MIISEAVRILLNISSTFILILICMHILNRNSVIYVFYLYRLIKNYVLQILNMANADQPIYPDADITKAQSLLLILSFLLKHHLSDEVLKDLLGILNVLLPETFPKTKYMFYKAFRTGSSQVCNSP